ncbi:MAG: NUDIX domain-containing protein [Pedobacter sp.]|nr:MAG: NUDIX domain-containing protein [Pedobacter sp.]
MPQKYRIYINDSTLFITTMDDTAIENAQSVDLQNFDFLTFYAKIKKGSPQVYELRCPKAKKMLKKIKKQCHTIKAGGGLVYNTKGEILIIYRNQKWDLPKGKIEEGEKLKHTAVREVEEECGVKITTRNHLICKTFHVYEHHHEVCLKQTNWYHMEVQTPTQLLPQTEEGIEKVEWVHPNDLKHVINNTYPSILEVFKKSKLLANQ